MNKKFKIVFSILLTLAVIALATMYLSKQDMVVLNPKGAIGIKERDLLVTASLLMLIVVLPVFAMLIYFIWKYRAGNEKAKYNPDWDNSHLAEALWWGVPFIIIAILAVITWTSSHDLDPFKPIKNGKKPLEIQVVALEWKWLFIYPEQGIATVNFVEFPEKTPISFEITADAPMNSFWIPQLGGQIYAMPSMRSKLHLIANQKGNFRGCSANISGDGFAGMTFIAKATSEKDFERWVESVKRSKKELTVDEYNQLSKPSSYHPVTSYVLDQTDLFDQIIMKYSMPMNM
jgi:cytochrome o ubiquinol oxidase subunit 2